MKERLIFAPNLYLGEGISADKVDRIKNKLQNKPISCGETIIALSRNPSDQLEIYQARQLVQSYYQKNPPYVVGLASDREEALALVQQIVLECMERRGGCALKEYLLC
ncbi:MAG: hypothetical protein NC081_02315 [Roseburia sp.]|nr:hypothetical protein [Roseburia sp.]